MESNSTSSRFSGPLYLNTRSTGLPVGGRRVYDVGIAVEELADALAGNGHHLQVLKRYDERDAFESSAVESTTTSWAIFF